MTKYGLGLVSKLLVTAGLITGAAAQSNQPIRIGVPVPIQLQVGRDSQDAIRMAVDEINAKGGVLGRKLDMLVEDETLAPEQGINAIKKLTSDYKADVLIGGFSSGVVLAEMPHSMRAKTLHLTIGAVSPALSARVKADYETNKYFFRVYPLNATNQAEAIVDYAKDVVLDEMKFQKIAIVGENSKWVQDMVPVLRKGITQAGMDVRMVELFDVQMSDLTPIFAKAKSSEAQFILVLLGHTASDIFVKQWHDARVPLPIGGVDVRGQESDYFARLGGKSVSETVLSYLVRAPITPKTVPFWDAFVKRYNREPVYTGPGAYDAVYMYAEAVTRAGSTDPDKVTKELEKTDHVGVAGRYAFNDSHDLKTGKGYLSLLMVQWLDNGDRAVVWPKEYRNGSPVMPPWMRTKN